MEIISFTSGCDTFVKLCTLIELALTTSYIILEDVELLKLIWFKATYFATPALKQKNYLKYCTITGGGGGGDGGGGGGGGGGGEGGGGEGDGDGGGVGNEQLPDKKVEDYDRTICIIEMFE